MASVFEVLQHDLFSIASNKPTLHTDDTGKRVSSIDVLFPAEAVITPKLSLGSGIEKGGILDIDVQPAFAQWVLGVEERLFELVTKEGPLAAFTPVSQIHSDGCFKLRVDAAMTCFDHTRTVLNEDAWPGSGASVRLAIKPQIRVGKGQFAVVWFVKQVLVCRQLKKKPLEEEGGEVVVTKVEECLIPDSDEVLYGDDDF
jgi:hypothetical protein